MKAKWTVVMLLIATGVIALAFTPWTRDVAALWWFVGLLLIIGAGVSSVVEARRSGRTPDSRNRWARITQVTAAFLVAALAGYWLTDVASPDSDDIAFSVPDEAPRVALAASRHLTVDLSEDAVKPAVEQWAASEKEFVDVPASTSSRLRNELMAADFRSTSGLSRSLRGLNAAISRFTRGFGSTGWNRCSRVQQSDVCKAREHHGRLRDGGADGWSRPGPLPDVA